MTTTHDLAKSNCPHCGAKNDTNLYEIDYEKHTVKLIPQMDHRCLAMAEAELSVARGELGRVRAVLKELEWSAEHDRHTGNQYCPICGMERNQSHDSGMGPRGRPACRLAAALGDKP